MSDVYVDRALLAVHAYPHSEKCVILPAAPQIEHHLFPQGCALASNRLNVGICLLCVTDRAPPLPAGVHGQAALPRARRQGHLRGVRHRGTHYATPPSCISITVVPVTM